jgi:hypothetical protein
VTVDVQRNRSIINVFVCFFRATKQYRIICLQQVTLTPYFFTRVRDCQYTNLTDTKHYFFYVRLLFWVPVLLLGISDCNTPVFRADGQSEMRLKCYNNIVHTATDVRSNQRTNDNAWTSCSRVLKQQGARNRRHASNRGRAKISFCEILNVLHVSQRKPLGITSSHYKFWLLTGSLR